MYSKWLKSALVLVITLLFITPPCWAKAKGYCFIVGYAYKLKQVYFSPVFVVKIRNKSYSATEYVTDVGLLREMESQFLRHLGGSPGVAVSKFTVAPRGAYKSQNFASQGLAKEKADFAKKGFKVMDQPNFTFKD